MKKDLPDSSRKKMVAEMLKSADRLLKAGEYDQALAEVEKSLELEPGNFYAQAYKERITALREKHGQARPAAPAAGQKSLPVDPAIPEAEIISDTPEPPAAEPGLPAPPPAMAGESAPGEPADAVTEAGATHADADIVNLREQLERERAAQESEAARQAEELARQALEREITEGAAAEKLKAAERAATERAIGEGRSKARAGFILKTEEALASLLASGDVEGAYREFATLTIVDPKNAKLGDFRGRIDAATDKALSATAGEPPKVSRETAGVVFGKILKAAWREGSPDAAQKGAIDSARTRLEITPEEEKALMTKVQREVIAEAMREAYRDGDPDPETKAFLDSLTTAFSPASRSGS